MIILRHIRNGLLSTVIQTSKYTKNVNKCISTKTDILQDIKDEDLPALRDMYKHDWPRLVEPYLFINNYINWKQKNPATKVDFFCPEGRWDDGTFIAVGKEGMHNLYLYTLEQSCDRLAAGLTNTKRIDWKKGPMIYSMHENFKSKINPILKSIGQPIKLFYGVYIWHLPKQAALNFNPICPADCYFDNLSPEHAAVISDNWLVKCPGTAVEDYVRNIIKMNSSQGLFGKADGELRASAVVTDMGSSGMLLTAKNHQRKGYGKLMIEHFGKMTAGHSELVVYTVEDNKVIYALLTAIGAKIINLAQLCQFETTVT